MKRAPGQVPGPARAGPIRWVRPVPALLQRVGPFFLRSQRYPLSTSVRVRISLIWLNRGATSTANSQFIAKGAQSLTKASRGYQCRRPVLPMLPGWSGSSGIRPQVPDQQLQLAIAAKSVDIQLIDQTDSTYGVIGPQSRIDIESYGVIALSASHQGHLEVLFL